MNAFQYKIARIFAFVNLFNVSATSNKKIAQERLLLSDAFFALGLACWEETEGIPELKKKYWEFKHTLIEEHTLEQSHSSPNKKPVHTPSPTEQENQEEQDEINFSQKQRLELLAKQKEIHHTLTTLKEEQKEVLNKIDILKLQQKIASLQNDPWDNEPLHSLERELSFLLKKIDDFTAENYQLGTILKKNRHSPQDTINTIQKTTEQTSYNQKRDYLAEIKNLNRKQYKILLDIGKHIFTHGKISLTCDSLLNKHKREHYIASELFASIQRHHNILIATKRLH